MKEPPRLGGTNVHPLHHREQGTTRGDGSPEKIRGPGATKGPVGAPSPLATQYPAAFPGLMVTEPGTFALAAPGEDVKFPSFQVRLATKSPSPGTL